MLAGAQALSSGGRGNGDRRAAIPQLPEQAPPLLLELVDRLQAEGASATQPGSSGYAARRSHYRHDKAAQMSIAFPLCCCRVKVPLLSIVKTRRPTYSVVVGPAGTSVGKRMRMLCPMVTTVCDPSGLFVTFVTAPFDLSES